MVRFICIVMLVIVFVVNVGVIGCGFIVSVMCVGCEVLKVLFSV